MDTKHTNPSPEVQKLLLETLKSSGLSCIPAQCPQTGGYSMALFTVERLPLFQTPSIFASRGDAHEAFHALVDGLKGTNPDKFDFESMAH
ncbi:MAG: hypothetical protein WAZ18_01350 [Alphaproteobacteria bacterium]